MSLAGQVNSLEIRVTQALLDNSSVGDCAVLLRNSADSAELVGYVVPTGPFSAERLLAGVRARVPEMSVSVTLVPVSSIPLRADGSMDSGALTQIPVADAATVMHCRELLRHHPETSVEVRERRLGTQLLHVSDVLPQQINKTFDEDAAAVRRAQRQETSLDVAVRLSLSRAEPLPENPDGRRTLSDALQRAANQFPQKGVIYIRQDGSDTFQPYPALLETAERVLGGLRRKGLKSGDPVLFQLDRADDFIAAFWGCVLGGFVPTPVSIAPTYDQVNGTVAKLHNAWQMLSHPMVLTGDALTGPVSGIPALLPAEGFRVQPIRELLAGPRDSDWHISDPDDLALLLLTSGSTGAPKAVMQSHRALLSRSAAAGQMNCFTSEDVSLNWLPLDHVGGIVMFHLHDVVAMCTQVHGPTQEVLAEPLRWLDWLDRYRVTSTWAPNFAFGLVNARGDEIARRRWDLSHLRFILNGGEAIVSKTARKFLTLLAPHGLAGAAMYPAWGMSETCSGVTFTRDFSLDRTSDDDLFVEVGEPVPGFAMRIVDGEDRVVPEGALGRLQVSGPSVLSGYYQNPEANRNAFTSDGWFITGDLGYLRNGRLTITGREKDVIIINGANFHSHEIEKVVEEIPGIAPSFAAAFAVRERSSDTDRLAICFSLTAGACLKDAEMTDLLRQVRAKVFASIGVSPSYLVPVPTDAIPKTSIGKIQRSELALRLRAGEFNEILKRVDLALENSRTIPNWFYRKTWRLRQAVEAGAPFAGRCLIFADGSGLGERLARDVRQRGGASILARRNSAFSRLSADEYALDPADPAQYRSLFEAVSADGGSIAAVVHLWACDTVCEPASQADLESALDSGVKSVLHVVQALQMIRAGEGAARLLVVTCGAQSVGAPVASSAHSAIAGFVKTVSQEVPWMVCRHIDLESTHEANAQWLSAELAVLPADVEVAYRGGRRWVSRLLNADLASTEKLPLPFTQGGLYLLTGGLGAIALEVARYLMKEYGARLLLIGRTPLHLVEAGGRTAFSELQLLGNVQYADIDVCDAEAVERLVTAVEAEWRTPLAGVLHLAGAYEERMIVEETRTTFQAIIGAKVQGTWALRQMLRQRPAAFLIGFSSVNGFFGGFSSGAYAAANGFLDGSIEQEHAAGRRSISLAWSLWDEVGMSRGFQMKELSRSQGYLPVSRTQGLRSFLAALQSQESAIFIGLDVGGAQVRRQVDAVSPLRTLVITTTNRQQRDAVATIKGAFRDRFGCPIAPEIVEAATIALDAGAAPARVSAQPASELERAVARIWADALGTEVDLDANFFDLGGTSVLAAQVYRMIHEQVGGGVTMTDLFRFPTVRSLCGHIAGGDRNEPVRLKADGVRGRNSREQLSRRRAAALSGGRTRGA